MVLTENDIKRMVNETVRRVIKEYYGTFDDTTDAPWNNDEGRSSEESVHWEEYYVDLTELVQAHPELQKLLKGMVLSGWDECNIGPVEIKFMVDEWGFEKDEDGYPMANNSEIQEDSIQVTLDQSNKYKMLLPDKLVSMIEDIATKQFLETYSIEELEK